MSNIRVYELAKEFNKETKEVLEVLQKGGFSVKNNFSSVGDAEREALKKHYHKGAAPAAKAPAKEAKPKAEVKEVRENAPEKAKKGNGEKSQSRPQHKENHEHKEHRENRDNNQRKASSNNGNGNNRSHEGGSRGGHSEHNNNNNNDDTISLSYSKEQNVSFFSKKIVPNEKSLFLPFLIEQFFLYYNKLTKDLIL